MQLRQMPSQWMNERKRYAGPVPFTMIFKLVNEDAKRKWHAGRVPHAPRGGEANEIGKRKWYAREIEKMRAIIRDPRSGAIQVVAGTIAAVRAVCDHAAANGGIVECIDCGGSCCGVAELDRCDDCEREIGVGA